MKVDKFLLAYDDSKDDLTISMTARSIPLISKYIKKDKDRLKKNSIRFFKYVFLRYDYRSMYVANYTEDEAEIEIRNILEIEKKWKPSIIEKEIIEFYQKELNSFYAIKAINESRQSLLSGIELMKLMRGEIKSIINILKSEKHPEDGASLEVDEKFTYIKSATTLLKDIERITQNLPKNLDIIKDTEQKIKEQLAEGSRIKGEGTLGKYED